MFTIHHHWLVTSEVICWIWRFSSKGGGVDFVRWKVWARKSCCKFVMLTNHVTISTDILFDDPWCLLHEIYISPIILILPNKYLTWTRTCWPWSNIELARRSWVGLLWSPWTACMAQQTSNGPGVKKKLQHPFGKGGWSMQYAASSLREFYRSLPVTFVVLWPHNFWIPFSPRIQIEKFSFNPYQNLEFVLHFNVRFKISLTGF